ncbi:flagellar basal body-associated FliL family protein [Nocardioides sp. 616]|uniref:flagellar basal body-associated FliL family protein n=1 Tax=Nocardioides sp. 616 TaxID=2268090 RepID=UPI000CE4268C|nr:flagellar basal body-associated FliL family protein [Nocardioides sp. 616]
MTVTAMTPPGAATRPPEAEESAGKGGGKKKKLLIIAVVLLVLGGAGWFFFLKPSGPTEPVAGEVVTLEPMQLNLAAGHYLRLGMALQLVEGAHELDGSKALDAAITIFSGHPVAEVVKPEQREELRAELMAELEHSYHGDVMEVYFTEFVTQ